MSLWKCPSLYISLETCRHIYVHSFLHYTIHPKSGYNCAVYIAAELSKKRWKKQKTMITPRRHFNVEFIKKLQIVLVCLSKINSTHSNDIDFCSINEHSNPDFFYFWTWINFSVHYPKLYLFQKLIWDRFTRG